MIAGHRDDGLHPRLRELMEERRRHAAAAALLDAYRANPVMQAGPNPGTGTEATLPEGVVRLLERRPAARAAIRTSNVNE